MQNLPLSNSTYAVFTPVQFFVLGGGGGVGGCFTRLREQQRWPEGGAMVSKCTNTMMDTSSAAPANHCCRFVYTGPKWLPDWPPLHIKQTNNRDTLVEDTSAAKHQQCADSLGNSRLITLYVQMGIQQLIDSILNRAVLLPIHCTFWQGTCKTVFSTYISTYSA